MRNLAYCTLIFLCLALSCTTSKADDRARNWCGVYHEENQQGYIRLPLGDLKSGLGSKNCDSKYFNGFNENANYVDLALNMNKHQSTINKWKKFENHFLKVRGKYRNRTLHNTRFVKDWGLFPTS